MSVEEFEPLLVVYTQFPHKLSPCASQPSADTLLRHCGFGALRRVFDVFNMQTIAKHGDF